MATGFVQVPPDSTGKKVDCVSLSAGGQTVVRQTVVIADPTKSAGYAIVSGGQQLVKGAFTLGSGTNQIGYLQKISASVTVQGNVALNAGAAHIGEVNISLMPAVVLAAGAAHVGEVNISTMPAVNISAMPAVALAAGAAHIGEVNISVMPAVVLAAGAANIGTIQAISAPVVLAAGAAHIGEVNISLMPQVSVLNVAGTAMIGAVSVGAIASITAPINISAMPAVVLAAGANEIGSLKGISSTVIAAMSRVKLSASANIADNTVGMAWADKHGRLVTITNHPALLPSASHGPKTVVVSTSASVALVAAPGANLSVYVTGLMATNGSTTLTRADCYQASATAAPDVAQYLAASGGGFSVKFDPPWQISANTALNARIKPNASQALFTIHFYVAPA